MINKEQFETIQDGQRVRLNFMTVPKLKGGKANPDQGRIQKVTTGAIGILYTSGRGYFEKVNEGLIAEGKAPDFEPKPRAWGVRVEGTPLIEHKGKFYLDVVFEHPGETEYFFHDEPIKKEDIEGLEDKKEGEQGGLEEKVYVRTISLESLGHVELID
jgi:hypothetical protein